MNANGIIIVDKPAGPTSHDVVARVRQILHTRRVGHTGTLDPFATGVLVICFGRATRLAQFFLRDEKEYIARMRLGWSTDTGDLTGAQLSPPTDVGNLTREQVSTELDYFRGHIKQVPPMYAAKKINGVKLYEMARRGHVIQRTPIDVDIKELELLAVERSGNIQDVTFRVVCSSGTYVRVLAEDIGQRLGVGAHLVALQRTRAGRCVLSDAVTLDRLAELEEAGLAHEALMPVGAVLALRQVGLTPAEQQLVLNGRGVGQGAAGEPGESAMLCGEHGQLLAIAEYDAVSVCWQPRVVIADVRDGERGHIL
jgi:tRNA pseudouridine55 synthase